MLARKSFIQFLGGVTLALLGMVATIIIARTLGPAPLGTVGYALGLAGLFFLGSDLGSGQAHAKRISEGQNLGIANGTFFAIKGVLLGVSALALGIFLALARLLGWEIWGDPTTREVFLLIAVALFFEQAASAIIITFQARQEVTRFNIPQIIARLTKLGIVLLIAALALGSRALALAYLIESAVLLFGVLWMFRSYPVRGPRRTMLHSYWRYSVPFIVMMPLSLLAENLDKVLLKALASVEQVGYYIAVQGIMAIVPLVFSKPAMSVFFPHVSALNTTKDLSRIRESTELIVRFLSMFTVPLIMLLIAFREDLVSLVLGPRYLSATDVFLVGSITVYVITIIRPYLNVLYGMERHHSFPLVSVLLLPVTILGYLFFVPHTLGGIPTLGLGATGIVLTTLIVWLLDGIIKIVLFHRATKGTFYWRVSIHLAAGLAAFGTITLLERIFGIPHTVRTPSAAITILLGLGVYGLILVITREFTRADIRFLWQAVSPRNLFKEISHDLTRKESKS